MIWILFIGGFISVVSCILFMLLAYQSTHWEKVNGEILSSQIIKSNMLGSEYYRPLIEYQYTVNGKSYSSNYIGYFAGFVEKELSENLVGDKQQGDSVTVYYHSLIPKIAVLVPGLHQISAWVLILITGCVILASSSIALFSSTPLYLQDLIFSVVNEIIT